MPGRATGEAYVYADKWGLDADGDAGVEAARERRAVDVAGVALGTFVEIALIGVEDVADACVDVQVHAIKEAQCVIELDGGVEERFGVTARSTSVPEPTRC